MTEAEARAYAALERCRAEIDRAMAELAGEADPVTAKLAELHESCRARGIVVTDGGVDEYAAAQLTGIKVGTLANRRWRGDAPEFFKTAARRIRYRLTDLAEFLVAISQ